MNTYIVIGAPGQGKSPWIKELIKDRRCFVFDIQNEYGERVKYPGLTPVNLSNNINAERARYTGNDVKEFLKYCKLKRSTIIVFEEATAFFAGKVSDMTLKHLIDRYHTRNSSVFVFHSINRVPPAIFEMCSHVVLFRTLDNPDIVLRKFPALSQPFLELQEDQTPDAKRILKML